MTTETRNMVQSIEANFIQEAEIIVVNQDLCEIQQYTSRVDTFKDAENFINIVKQDESLLRRVYFACALTMLDRDSAHLAVFEFDNYNDLFDFVSHANWLTT